ncbi:NCS2 family permease [bacterium]|nr:NCS2 family permease [bacterium]
MKRKILSFFRVEEAGSTLRTEVVAGLTTFMTMSYIVFANPSILQNAGLPLAPTIGMTAIAAAIPTLLMGLWANYPFALAPGMGLNAFLTFEVCKKMGYSWQTGMGVIFIEGLIVTIFVLTGAREAVMNAIPISLKRAISVGIGLFIAFIGLKDAHLVVASEATFVTFGSIKTKEALLALFGLLFTAYLLAKGIRGAILLGIVTSTIVAIPLGLAELPKGIVSMPSFETFGRLDILSALKLSLFPVIFAFLVTDFFDTMGTVIGVGGQGGFLSPDGKLPRLGRVLLVDSLAAMWGAICSASSVTTYIESAAGVSAGGRTGLVSLVVAILFLITAFFSPLLSIVPSVAVAPALIIVGFLMMSVVKDIPWDDVEEAFPAFVILLTIPLTYSISHGIGYGFIIYSLVKLLTGKAREVHPLMFFISLVFIVSFIIY